jgi:hypothetical protein
MPFRLPNRLSVVSLIASLSALVAPAAEAALPPCDACSPSELTATLAPPHPTTPGCVTVAMTRACGEVTVTNGCAEILRLAGKGCAGGAAPCDLLIDPGASGEIAEAGLHTDAAAALTVDLGAELLEVPATPPTSSDHEYTVVQAGTLTIATTVACKAEDDGCGAAPAGTPLWPALALLAALGLTLLHRRRA